MMLPDFRVRQRDYLLEISRALTQELDLEKLLARILPLLRRHDRWSIDRQSPFQLLHVFLLFLRILLTMRADAPPVEAMLAVIQTSVVVIHTGHILDLQCCAL